MENENTNINAGEELNNSTTETERTKTYTLDEVNQLLQKEGDRRVSQALAKQKKEYDKKLNLAGLDEAQRDKAEKEMRIKELEDQLAAFTIEKNRSELKTVLSTRGLSAEFADIISITDDVEASQKNIDTLDKLFKAAVKAEVEKRLSGNTPKGNNSSSAAMDKTAFMKLPLYKQQELLNTNQAYYSQFLK